MIELLRVCLLYTSQPLHYRNQCKLPLQMEQGKLCSGMYLPGSNYFASVKNCVIHHPLIETVRTVSYTHLDRIQRSAKTGGNL